MEKDKIQKQIDEVMEFKRLFTEEHLKLLEKLCEVWRKTITNDGMTEQFYLGKRSVYIAVKDKLETDINQYQQYLKSLEENEL